MEKQLHSDELDAFIPDHSDVLWDIIETPEVPRPKDGFRSDIEQVARIMDEAGYPNAVFYDEAGFPHFNNDFARAMFFGLAIGKYQSYYGAEESKHSED